MKLYLAGPMRGYPEFNFPAFRQAAAWLREQGHFVFSPHERDEEKHGSDVSTGNVTGDEEIAKQTHGFNLREALFDDLKFITLEAEGIAMLPGWEKSKGANAERATAIALGLDVYELDKNYDCDLLTPLRQEL